MVADAFMGQWARRCANVRGPSTRRRRADLLEPAAAAAVAQGHLGARGQRKTASALPDGTPAQSGSGLVSIRNRARARWWRRSSARRAEDPERAVPAHRRGSEERAAVVRLRKHSAREWWKLADALDLGSKGETRGGSTPPARSLPAPSRGPEVCARSGGSDGHEGNRPLGDRRRRRFPHAGLLRASWARHRWEKRPTGPTCRPSGSVRRRRRCRRAGLARRGRRISARDGRRSGGADFCLEWAGTVAERSIT